MSRHAIDRAEQRYDLKIGFADIDDLRLLARPGEPRAIAIGTYPHEGRVAKLWALRFYPKGDDARWLISVIVDGAIVTFLPRDQIPTQFHKILGRRKKDLIAAGLEPKNNRSAAKARARLLREDKEAAWEHFRRLSNPIRGHG